jgi:uncharacterized protein YbbC (DUF1343 family)
MKWGISWVFVINLLIFISVTNARFKLGIENLSPQLVEQLQQQRVGLITNQTGRNQRGERTIKVLRDNGVVVSTIFAPEHGYNGVVSAGQQVIDEVDEITGTQIKSLYQALHGNQLSKESFVDIDLLLFDLQDVGMRHYTYISTLFRVMQAIKDTPLQLIVLDRPNLLGSRVQGPGVEDNFVSFISIADIPLRHGLTMGELSCYYNNFYFNNRVQLEVVKMRDYNRKTTLIKQLLAPLSPNLSSVQSCYGYSFLGLLGEVAPFDVGVGSDKPFRVIALPRSSKVNKQFWKDLHSLLKDQGIYDKKYEFFNINKNRWSRGLELIIPYIDHVENFDLFIDICLLAKKYDIALQFAPTFDKAIGTDYIRQWLQDTNHDKKVLQQMIDEQHKEFADKIRGCLLYCPAPND